MRGFGRRQAHSRTQGEGEGEGEVEGVVVGEGECEGEGEGKAVSGWEAFHHYLFKALTLIFLSVDRREHSRLNTLSTTTFSNSHADPDPKARLADGIRSELKSAQTAEEFKKVACPNPRP